MAAITRYSSAFIGPMLGMFLVAGCYTQLETVQSEGEDEAGGPAVSDSTVAEPEDSGTSSTQVYFHYYYPSGFVFAGGYYDPWYYGWPAYDPYYYGAYYSPPFVGIWFPVHPYSYYPYPAPCHYPYDGGYAYGNSGYGERRTFGSSRGGSGSGSSYRGSPLIARTSGSDESLPGATIGRPAASGNDKKTVSAARPVRVSYGNGARTQGTSRSGNKERVVREPSTQQRPSSAGQEKGAVGRSGNERSGQSPSVQAPPRTSPPPSHSGSGYSGGGARGGSPRGGRR